MGTLNSVRWCGIALAAIVLCCHVGTAQGTRARNKVELFQAYFDALATEPHTPKDRTPELDSEHLVEMIPTMTDAELQQALSIIDTAIDQARISHDGIPRLDAALFLWHISETKDGPALLAPEISHLSALCRDPFTLGGSMYMLISLQRQYPELSVPAMLRAIKAPNANDPTGNGPAYATILFFYPRDGDLVKEVIVYMKRPDLTGQKLLDFLTGISAGGSMPDAVVEQLLHHLDAPEQEIRLAALRDISEGGFAERKRLRPLFQRLVDDPAQSSAFHKLAVELLDSNQLFSLDPDQ